MTMKRKRTKPHVLDTLTEKERLTLLVRLVCAISQKKGYRKATPEQVAGRRL
jgi:hypothetical protein